LLLIREGVYKKLSLDDNTLSQSSKEIFQFCIFLTFSKQKKFLKDSSLTSVLVVCCMSKREKRESLTGWERADCSQYLLLFSDPWQNLK